MYIYFYNLSLDLYLTKKIYFCNLKIKVSEKKFEKQKMIGSDRSLLAVLDWFSPILPILIGSEISLFFGLNGLDILLIPGPSASLVRSDLQNYDG